MHAEDLPERAGEPGLRGHPGGDLSGGGVAVQPGVRAGDPVAAGALPDAADRSRVNSGKTQSTQSEVLVQQFQSVAFQQLLASESQLIR